jgi:hypothetical protein
LARIRWIKSYREFQFQAEKVKTVYLENESNRNVGYNFVLDRGKVKSGADKI